MTTDPPAEPRDRIPVSAPLPFLLMAFGLAWTVLGLFVFAPARMPAMFGEITGQHSPFHLAVYAPAIAAFVVILRGFGANGPRRFLSRPVFTLRP